MEDKYNEAKKIIEKYGQEQLLNQYDKLDSDKKRILLNQIFNIDFNQINNLYNKTKEEIKLGEDIIEPIKYIDKKFLTSQEKEYYNNLGEQEIKKGKLAVVTMAGGQGTRLRTWRTQRNIYIKCTPQFKVFI